MQVNIKHLIDDGQCYQTVRALRWPQGVACPSCQPTQASKRGCDDTESVRQRYECTDCHRRFDDRNVLQAKRRQGRRRRRKGKCGRGTLEKERPPVFGMIQRGGQVVINLRANVQHKTIEPFIKDPIIPGTCVYTDE